MIVILIHFMIDNLKHACGIFGVIGSPNAAKTTYLGLYALQHRGQESAGIITTDGKAMFERKGLGLVGKVFPDEGSLKNLSGFAAIGHNRYSTTGSTNLVNSQPLLIRFFGGDVAAAHNGNIVNAQSIRKEMEGNGSIFRTTTDTEVILHLMARSGQSTVPDMISYALQRIQGAYSLLFLTPDMLIAAKDPRSIRPLVLGRKDNAWFFASETCAFDLLEVEYIRCLEPGEMIVIRNGEEPESRYPCGKQSLKNSAGCIFEFIYFARPDSEVFCTAVDKIRRRMGRQLAREHPADADIVISIPDSSNTAALGYARESRLPFEIGLIRNHYIGRIFIQPEQQVRELSVRLKFNTVKGIIKGKRVVVVDDSIVRATTSRQLISMLRDVGAKEIHLRIASPPIVNPCFYGVDTPEKSQLIASGHNMNDIRDFIGADSLGYLSIKAMLQTSGLPKMGFCTACFGSDYPIPITDRGLKYKMG
jgi:amidophosphoribosyltransferase